ncbi:MAG: family 20 glycosylhydrolase, partial [Verrucomicrobiota bacterium]|nr:family 20 glycosylhydrolase [Verrucomicrobiota bacterium]
IHVPIAVLVGHMYKWLALPQFDGVKEVPGKANASTVALTNPETITFLKNLYGDLLPNFTSTYFNVGADETYEVGAGQSKVAYPDLSKEEIYLEGLKTIYGLVKEEGKTMMFWADMIVKYADSNPSIVRAAKQAIPDAIPINWGYQFDYDFEKSTTRLKNAGFRYYVSPGTTTWSSYIGRTSNMTKNLETAATWGRKNGAVGYLLTTWGDQGHHQNLICDYPPLAYAAGLSWHGDGNRKELVDYNQYVSRFIFKDTVEDLSAKFSKLADYGSLSPRCWSKSWMNSVGMENYRSEKNLLSFIKFQKGGSEEEKQAKALSQAEQVSAMCEEFLVYLSTVTMKADDAAIIQAELENGVRILKAAACYTAMRLRIHNGVSTPDQEAVKAAELYHEYKATLSRFKDVWMMRNRLSSRDDTMKKLYFPLKYFRHIAGIPYRPLPDGNHVLMTPDTLSSPLASDEFVSGWVWSFRGSGEPVMTSVYGVDSSMQIKGAIADGVISLLDNSTGVSGRVFCFDPIIARKKSYYEIWNGDGKTKLLPRFGWPVFFEQDSEYEISFKAKFRNGSPLNGNLVLSMTATQVDGRLKGVPLIATAYSEPDSNGWQTVTQRCVANDTIRTASFFISTSPATADVLYIADLFMDLTDKSQGAR